MMLAELATAMFRFSPTSDAWKDFAMDCRERLNVASNDRRRRRRYACGFFRILGH
jgi:hypothetical protein